MTAIALYDEALERLGRDDEVGVAETLKTEVAANTELLEQQFAAEPQGETGTADERVQTFLTAHGCWLRRACDRNRRGCLAPQ